MPFSGMTQVGTAVEEALTAANVTLPRPPGPSRPARPVRRVTSQPRAGSREGTAPMTTITAAARRVRAAADGSGQFRYDGDILGLNH
jgi:hypothetical protein